MRFRSIAILGVTLLFTVPSVAGAYTVEGPSKGTTEGSKEASEHAAQEQKEANERAAKAAEEKKATEERQQHEAAEHKEAQQPNEAAEPKTKEAEAPQCVVPSLKGDSLARAGTTLHKAHCKLGKVGGSHKGKAVLVVVSQKPKPGTKLAAGAAVGVTLGPAKHAHR
jgi:sRNA-binding protein